MVPDSLVLRVLQRFPPKFAMEIYCAIMAVMMKNE